MTVNREHGLLPQICEIDKRPICHEECAHSQDVIDQLPVLPSIGSGREVLHAWLNAILKTDELLVEEICKWRPSVCLLGESAGLSCRQCIVTQKAFSPCPTETFDCGDKKYITINPCYSTCADICNDKCISMIVDWSLDAELLGFYESIVTAIITASISPNIAGINSLISAVFNTETAKVIKYQSSIYYIVIPEVSDKVESALPVLERLLPLPPGKSSIFVYEIICN